MKEVFQAATREMHNEGGYRFKIWYKSECQKFQLTRTLQFEEANTLKMRDISLLFYNQFIVSNSTYFDIIPQLVTNSHYHEHDKN